MAKYLSLEQQLDLGRQKEQARKDFLDTLYHNSKSKKYFQAVSELAEEGIVPLPGEFAGRETITQIHNRLNSHPQSSSFQKVLDRQNHAYSRYLGAMDALVLNNLDFVRHYIKTMVLRKGINFLDFSKTQTYDDAVSEGRIGLLISADLFDPNKGNKFTTYAGNWIRQRIDREVFQKQDIVRKPPHIHQIFHRIVKVSNQMINDLKREPTPEEIAPRMNLDPKRVDEIYSAFRPLFNLDQDAPGPEGEISSNFEDPQAPSPFSQAVENDLWEIIDQGFKKLKPRARHILAHRLNLYGYQMKTMDVLAQELSISRQRINQIEDKTLESLTLYTALTFLNRKLSIAFH